MENIQSRIKRVRNEVALSAEDLAKQLNKMGFKITSRTIYAYEAGNRRPSASYLQALIEHFEVNSEWLLGGRGTIFGYPENTSDVVANVDLSNMVFLPLLDLKASAGYGALIEERAMTKDFIAFAKKWLEGITTTATKHLMMFTVKGDSMEGEIKDGDLIMVNENQKELTIAGTYVVCIDDQLYVKILQRIPGNKIQVISKNQKYPPFEVDLNSQHFQIVGRVVWSGSKSIN